MMNGKAAQTTEVQLDRQLSKSCRASQPVTDSTMPDQIL